MRQPPPSHGGWPETISGGEICIGERVVNKLAPRERDIAMVFQTMFYPHKTVRENMGFSLKVRGARLRMRKVASTKLLNARHRASLDRRPGQFVRRSASAPWVAPLFARRFSSLMSRCPTSMQNCGQVRTRIKRLHQQIGTTIIYVTHDQVEAMTLADRIVIRAGAAI